MSQNGLFRQAENSLKGTVALDIFVDHSILSGISIFFCILFVCFLNGFQVAGVWRIALCKFKEQCFKKIELGVILYACVG